MSEDQIETEFKTRMQRIRRDYSEIRRSNPLLPICRNISLTLVNMIVLLLT